MTETILGGKFSQSQLDSPSDIKLNFNLESDNFISEWISYNSRQTDSYIEYHHLGALTLLSIAADRKFVIPLSFGNVFTNSWLLALGRSSVSRKSTAFNYTETMARAYRGDRTISDKFSPESFIEQLTAQPRSFLIVDEAAAILSALTNKTYMAGFRDLLCKFYDGKSDITKLRTSQRIARKTEFDVRDPYLTMSWATTFKSFEASATELDVTSGLLARFLIYAPKYRKDIMGATIRGDDTEVNLAELGEKYKRILDAVQNIDGLVKLLPSEKAFDVVNKWDAEEQEKILGQGSDGPEGTVHARMFTSVFKLASLYYIGSEQLIKDLATATTEPEPVKRGNLEAPYIPITKVNIPDRYFMEAFKNVREYFAPVASDTLSNIQDAASKNIQVKIIRYLKDNGYRVKKNSILKYVKIKVKEFDEHIQALEQAGSIKIDVESNPTNPEDRRKDTTYVVFASN